MIKKIAKLVHSKDKIAQTPIIYQMQPSESGIACLAIILAYYNKWVSVEQLRMECGVSRDGLKIENIINVARLHQLDAEFEICEFHELSEFQAPLFFIGNDNNYVIYEGNQNNKIYLNDPAVGRKILNQKNHPEIFHGSFLIIKPNPNFKPDKSGKFNIINEIHKKLMGNYSNFLYLFIIGVLLIVPAIITPILIQQFIDRVLSGADITILPIIILAMAINIGFCALLSWLEQIALAKFYLKISINETKNFLYHLLRLPNNFFIGRAMGDIAKRVNNNDEIAEVMVYDFTHNIVQLFKICLFGAILLIYDYKIALVVIAINMMNFFVLTLIIRKVSDMSQRIMLDTNQLNGVAMAGIFSIDNIKSHALENYFFQKWADIHGKTIKINQRLQVMTNQADLMPIFLTSLTTMAVLGVGGLRYMEGLITIGGIVAVQGLAQNFIEPIRSFVGLASKLQEIKAKITAVNDVYSYNKDYKFQYKDNSNLESRLIKIKQIINDSPSGKLMGNITVENLTFSFGNIADSVLKDINLTIQAGKRTAIVGESGSGKSTLLKLICGIYQPNIGKIKYDNLNFQEIPHEIISESIAFVDQNIVLFSGSIKDNLTFWNQNIDDKNIFNSLKIAGFDRQVNQYKNRHLTKLNEQASNLSIGQKQQLEIARALLNNPSVLILDEATSCLDVYNQKIIEQNLRHNGCTTILASHRLSTIRECDNIILLKNKQIIAQGTHEELCASQTYYRELMDL